MSSRVVVLGGTGMLGGMMWRVLSADGFDVAPSFRASPDDELAACHERFVFDVDADGYGLSSIPECDYIVNCVGAIPQRMPTDEQYVRVNSMLPSALADAYTSSHTRVIHITTDCVFSGELGMYDEESHRDATDMYGVTKAAGEVPGNMSLRVSVVGPEYGGRSSNLLGWMQGQRGRTVKGYVDHVWNGLTTRELARCVATIIRHDMHASGTYHVFSDRPLTKHQMLRAFNQRYKLGARVVEHATGMLVDRTLRTRHELCSLLCVKSFEEMLREL